MDPFDKPQPRPKTLRGKGIRPEFGQAVGSEARGKDVEAVVATNQEP